MHSTIFKSCSQEFINSKSTAFVRLSSMHSTYSRLKIKIKAYSASFKEIRNHNNHGYIVLPNHSPKIVFTRIHWTLRRDERFTTLVTLKYAQRFQKYRKEQQTVQLTNNKSIYPFIASPFCCEHKRKNL